MMERVAGPNERCQRFPPAISSHAVWLSFRFTLSYRDVEDLLAERDLILADETVLQWCRKFGQIYANESQRRRLHPGDTWHLDEVFVPINGVRHYPWRAVDQDGVVLDILLQPRRDKRAAVRFLRKLLTGLAYVPRVIITDKLASYGAARREILPDVEHRCHKGLNNRAENAHQPTREHERRMRRFNTRNASASPTARSSATSARAATCWPPPIAQPAPRASPPGARSPAPRPWPDEGQLLLAVCLHPVDAHVAVPNLTVPRLTDTAVV
jgi:putative transposase